MPLERESAWSRRYRHPNGRERCIISRFDDGSATLTLDQLRSGWPTWTARDRRDLSQNCQWLHERADFADMLRFILKHGDFECWSGIALAVGRTLPLEEAVEALSSAVNATPIEHSANLLQALALTRHPAASGKIRGVLEQLLLEPTLWADDPFKNWFAFTATCCVSYLLQLGVAPNELEGTARALSQHICEGNRRTCSQYLAASYPWLSPPDPPKSPA
jgi:hypothetical protein